VVFIALGVAASRALLGVHWLTDVVAGVALGWGWFVVCAVLFGGRRTRLGEPAERIEAATMGSAMHDAVRGRRDDAMSSPARPGARVGGGAGTEEQR
jgi:hypothetical protein